MLKVIANENKVDNYTRAVEQWKLVLEENSDMMAFYFSTNVIV